MRELRGTPFSPGAIPHSSLIEFTTSAGPFPTSIPPSVNQMIAWQTPPSALGASVNFFWAFLKPAAQSVF